jgi:hypothetical protein
VLSRLEPVSAPLLVVTCIRLGSKERLGGGGGDAAGLSMGSGGRLLLGMTVLVAGAVGGVTGVQEPPLLLQKG